MADQKPSVCRIVLYHFKGQDGNIVSRPAIITAVNEAEGQDTTVSLSVHTLPHDNMAPVVWYSSIPQSDNVQENHWSWPPKV